MEDDDDFMLDDDTEGQSLDDSGLTSIKTNFDARRKIEIYLEEKALQHILDDQFTELAS